MDENEYYEATEGILYGAGKFFSRFFIKKSLNGFYHIFFTTIAIAHMKDFYKF